MEMDWLSDSWHDVLEQIDAYYSTCKSSTSGFLGELLYMKWRRKVEMMLSCKVSLAMHNSSPPVFRVEEKEEGARGTRQKSTEKLLSSDGQETKRVKTVTSRLQKCFVNSQPVVRTL